MVGAKAMRPRFLSAARSSGMVVMICMAYNTFNAEAFGVMKKDTVIINFARAELVDNAALFEAIDTGVVKRYITDFGSEELLNKNRVEVKVAIRQKLFKGNKAVELLALYKLICTDEERKALSMNYTDITSEGKQIQPTIIVADQSTADNLAKLHKQ